MTTLGKFASGVIGAAAFAMLGVAPSLAQMQPKTCPEGKALNGECANPALTQSMRLGTVVATQPKLAYTAPPTLPSQERGLAVAPSYHEVFTLYTFPPLNFPNIRNPRP